MAWEFELVAGPYRGPAGGVAWDGEGVLFSLEDESRVMRYIPSTGEVREFRKYTNRTNGLALAEDGDVYGCQRGSRRVISFKRDGSATLLADRLDGRFHNQPNDLVVDREGRIWFTDPYSPIPPSGPNLQGPLEHASVLQMSQRSSDGRVRSWSLSRMTYDTKGPTGILLSQDERTLYVSENQDGPDGKRELRAYPVLDDGTLGSYTVLHAFTSDHRGPHRGAEGMCLDSEGNIIACAGWKRSGPGPLVYVFSPSGQVLESHAVPADRPMSCTFGDAGLESLYVTSGEGHLYRVRNTGRWGWLLYPPA